MPRAARSSVDRHLEQSPEEGAVSHQDHPQILGGHIVAPLPLPLESLPLLREAGDEAVHQIRDQGVRLLYRTSWLIDEPRLNLVPFLLQLIPLVRRKQLSFTAALGVRRCAFDVGFRPRLGLSLLFDVPRCAFDFGFRRRLRLSLLCDVLPLRLARFIHLHVTSSDSVSSRSSLNNAR